MGLHSPVDRVSEIRALAYTQVDDIPKSTTLTVINTNCYQHCLLSVRLPLVAIRVSVQRGIRIDWLRLLGIYRIVFSGNPDPGVPPNGSGYSYRGDLHRRTLHFSDLWKIPLFDHQTATSGTPDSRNILVTLCVNNTKCYRLLDRISHNPTL